MGRRSRGGTARVLAAAFYAWTLILVVGAGKLAAIGGSERAGILMAWAALYAGAVLVPLSHRATGGGRFRARFDARPAAVIGFALVLALLSVGLLAPLLAGYEPTAFENPAQTRFAAPSDEHPLGTDRLGRDVFARLAFGARASLGIGVVAVLLSVVIALVLGALAAMAGSRLVDDVISRVTDGMLAFPRQLFVLTVVAFFTNSTGMLVAAIALTSWMRIARIVRGEMLRLKETEFVRAAASTGASTPRIVLRHVLPNALGPVIVAGTLNVGAVILLESYLSFLGLGVQPPAPSWGAMVFEGRDALTSAWWVSAAPAAAITVAVVAFNLVGDGLRDALDVRAPAKTHTA